MVGTDSAVDRRLSAAAELEVPFYPGMTVGVPSLPAVVEALTEGRYDLVHVCAPGPAGSGGAAGGEDAGRARRGLLPHGARGLRRAAPRPIPGVERVVEAALARVLRRVRRRPLPLGGVRCPAGRAGRRARRPLGPRRRRLALLAARGARGTTDGRIRVLYAGRLTREKGVDLLAAAFLAARARDPRLELVLAGGGPEEEALRARLRGAGTFLGWLDGEELARAYADADLFLFCSQTDTFGQVVLEAQASGLPVVAVAAGGPAELIEDGRTGVLCRASSERAGRRGGRAGRLRRGPASDWPAAAWRRCASAPGRPRWPRSARAGSRRWSCGARRAGWRRRREARVDGALAYIPAEPRWNVPVTHALISH